MNTKRRKVLRDILDRLEDIQEELDDLLKDEDVYRNSLLEDSDESEKYDSAESLCDAVDEALDGIGEAIDSIAQVLDEQSF